MFSLNPWAFALRHFHLFDGYSFPREQEFETEYWQLLFDEIWNKCMFEALRLMHQQIAKSHSLISLIILSLWVLMGIIMWYIIYMLISNAVPVILLKIPLYMLFVLIFILSISYFIQSYSINYSRGCNSISLSFIVI